LNAVKYDPIELWGPVKLEEKEIPLACILWFHIGEEAKLADHGIQDLHILPE
jgi:hypothetical protein